jgi:hypothetical protein
VRKRAVPADVAGSFLPVAHWGRCLRNRRRRSHSATIHACALSSQPACSGRRRSCSTHRQPINRSLPPNVPRVQLRAPHSPRSLRNRGPASFPVHHDAGPRTLTFRSRNAALVSCKPELGSPSSQTAYTGGVSVFIAVTRPAIAPRVQRGQREERVRDLDSGQSNCR